MSLNEARRLYDQGQQKLASGDLQGAIVKFQQALQFDPDDYPALLALGDALQSSKQYQNAIPNYQKAIKINQDSPDAYCGMGWALYKLEQHERALEAYTDANRTNPNSLRALNGLGNTLQALGNHEGAIKRYQEVIEMNPCYYAAHLGLGNAFKSLKRYEESLKAYQEAVRLDPNISDAHYSLGNILRELGKYEKALEAYKQAIKIDPNDQHAYNGIEEIFLSSKQHKRAIETYKELIGINLNFPHAYCYHGNALWRSKRYEEAINSYQQAIERDSSYYPAHCGHGDALWKLDRNEEAINSYRQSIKIEPNYYWAHNGLGNAFQGLEQYEKAFASYKEAVRINPGLPHAHSGQGDALWKLEKYSDAIVCYGKAIEIQSDYCYAYNGLGNVFCSLKNFKETIINYDKAIAIYPEYFNPWYVKGWAIWQSRGFEQAIIFCDDSILKLRNKGLGFREALGYLYLRKGQICYYQGKFQHSRFTNLLTRSINSYLAAIKIFEQISAKEPYLEALQNAIKVFLSLNRDEKADELLRKGTDYLDRWLGETPSPARRQAMALKFAGFDQLTVDRHIQAASQLTDEAAIQAKLKEAWETAEKGKNTCLSWLLYALSDEAADSSFEEVQQFLKPGTAIVYWHLSPAALTTFVLKFGELAPVLITQPSNGDRPASLQQLLKLEAWMKEWDNQYSDYRNKGKEQRDADHPWRREMAQRLFERQAEPGNLKEILKIETIEQHLEGIDRLILIPHRDLHRFPLHALFNSRWVVSYLPSVRVGLTLQGRKPKSSSQLFSIENPQSSQAPDMRLALLESQMISQYFQNVRSLQEANATHEQVISALAENHTILHFSGHGSHHFENPGKSALLLAGTENLTLEEICQQDLTSYDLVSLSACETALTNNQSITTEYVGLVSGFLSQGAAQVLSTLWVVKSAVSAVIMIEFYRARRAGQSDVVVLAETLRWFRSLNQPKFEQWCQDCLKDLATLPPKRQSELKRMFEMHIGVRWNTIKEDVQHPYAWAAFTLSGGFFS